ncbi:hypothetical protein Tco_1361966 [Tanacetum coccineum]
MRRNEKEMPADFLVEIPFEDNEKEENSKEVPDSYRYTYAYMASSLKQQTINQNEALLVGLRIAQEMEIAKVGSYIPGFPASGKSNKRSIEEKQVLKVAMQERKSWMGTHDEYLLSDCCQKTQRKLGGSEYKHHNTS